MSIGYDPSDQFPPGILHINLYYGRNLRAKEMMRTVDRFAGRADPYAIINFGGKEARSKVCLDEDASPEWNQHFTFPINRPAGSATPTRSSDKLASKAQSSRGFKKLFTSRPSADKSIFEPDTLEIKLLDKNNFRQDYDMGKVKIPNLPRIITTQRDWYLEKQAFPVYDETKLGDTVYAGEIWMEIGFEKVDEFDFAMDWISDPTVDDRMHEFIPLLREPEKLTLPGEDDNQKIQDLNLEVTRLSGMLTSLRVQLGQARKAYKNLQIQSGDEVAQANAAAETFKSKLEACEHGGKETQDLLSKVQNELEVVRSELEKSREDAVQLEDKVRAAVEQTVYLNTENKELQDEASALRQELHASAENYQTVVRDLHLEKEDHLNLRDSHSTLQEDRHQIAQELIQSQKVVEELQAERPSIMEENASFAKLVSQLEARLTSTMDQTIDVESQNKELRTTFARLELEAGELREELQVAKIEHLNIDRDFQLERESHTGLQASHASLQERKGELEGELVQAHELLQELQTQKVSAQEENAYLTSQVATLEARLETSVKQTADIEMLNQELQQIVTKFEVEVNVLKEHLHVAEREYRNADRELRSERESHLDLQASYSALGEKEGEIQQELLQVQKLLDELQSHKASLLDQNRSLGEEVTSLKENKESAVKRIAELETVNKELQETVTRSELQAESLRDDFQLVVEKHLIADRDLQYERENYLGLQSSHASLQRKSNEVEGSLLRLQLRYEEVVMQRDSLMQQYADSADRIQELDAKLRAAEKQTLDLEKLTDDLHGVVTSSDVENKGLREELQLAIEKHLNTDRDLQAERDSHIRLQAKHASMEVVRGELEREVDHLQSHKESVLDQNAVFCEKVAGMELELELAEKHVTDLETENKGLLESITSFKVETNNLRDNLRSAVDKHMSTDRDLQTERDSHLGLQSKHASSERIRVELERDLDQLRSHREAALEHNALLTENIAKLEAELKLNVHHTTHLETVNEELQETVRRMEVDINNLQDDLRSAADNHLSTHRDLETERESHLGLQSKHASLEGIRIELERELDQLQSYKEEVLEHKAVLTENIAKLEAELKLNVQHTTQVEKVNEELQGTVRRLELDNNHLQDELRTAVDKHLTTYRDLQSERDSHLGLQSKHASLEGTRIELETKLDQLRSQNEEALEHNALLTENIAKLEAELKLNVQHTTHVETVNGELQDTVRRLEVDNNNLQEELRTAVDKHLSTDRDLQIERDSHQGLQSEHASLEGIRIGLERELDQLQAHKEAALEHNALLTQTIAKLEAELKLNVQHTTQVETVNEELQKTVGRLQVDINNLQDYLRTAVDKHLSTDRDLQTERNRHLGLQSEHVSLEGIRIGLERELDQLRSHKEAALEHNALLTQTIAKLEAELKLKVQHTTQVETVNEELQDTVRRLEVDNSNLQDDLHSAVDKHLTTDRDLQTERDSHLGLQSKHASLERIKVELERDLDQLRSQKEAALEHNALLKENIAKLEEELKLNAQQTTHVETVNEELQESVRRMEVNNNNLQDDLRSAVDKHLSTYRDLQTERDSHLGLQSKHASLEGIRIELERDLDQLRTHQEKALEHKAVMTENIAKLEAELKLNVHHTTHVETVNEELQNIVRRLEVDINNLQDNLRTAVDKHLSTDRDLQTERDSHLGLQSEHASLEGIKVVLEREVNQLRSHGEAALEHNALLTETIAKLEAEHKLNVRHTTNVETLNEELQDTVRRMEVDNNNLQHDKEAALEHNAKLTENIAELEAELILIVQHTTHVETVNEELQDTVRRLEVDSNNLQEELRTVVDKHLSTDRDLQTERDIHLGLQSKHASLDGIRIELETELDQLRSHNEVAVEHNAFLSGRVSALEAELNLSASHTTHLETLHKELQETIRSLESDTNTLQDSLRSAVEEHLSKDRDLQAEREKLLALQAKLASLEVERIELERELAQLRSHKEAALEHNELLTEDIAKLEAELRIKVKLEAELNIKVQHTTHVETVNEELQDTVRRLEVDNNNLQDELRTAVDKHLSTDRDLQTERDSLLGLKSKHASLEGIRIALDRELDQLRSHYKATLEQNAVLTENIAQLEAELKLVVQHTTHVETVNEELQDTVIRRELDNNNLQDELRTAVDKHLSTDRDLQTERESLLGLQSKHASLDGIRIELERELDQLRSHSEATLERNAVLTDNIAKLEAELKLKVQHTTHVETVNEELQDTVRRLELDNNNLQDELRRAVDKHLTTDRDLQTERDSHLGLQSKHASLDDTRIELETELDQLRSQNEEALEHNALLTENIAKLEAELKLNVQHTTHLDTVNGELQDTVRRLKVDNNNLQEELRTAVNKHLNTDRDLQTERDSHLGLQSRHASLEGRRIELETELDQLRSYSEEALEHNALLTENIAKLEAELKLMVQHTTQVETVNEELQETVTYLELDNNNLHDELRTAVDKHLSTDRDLQTERASHLGLQSKHASLEGTRIQLETELDKLRSKNEEALEHNALLTENIAKLEAELKLNVQHTTHVETVNGELQDTVRRLEVDSNNLQEELRTAVDKHLSTDRDLQTERDIHLGLQSKHASLDGIRIELETELDQLRSHNEVAVEHNAFLSGRVSALEAELNLSASHTTHLETLHKELQETVRSLESDTNTLQDSLRSAVEEHLSKDRDLQAEKENLLALQAELASLEVVRNELEREVYHLQSRTDSVLEQNALLIENVAALEGKLELAVKHLTDFETVNKELRESIMSFEEETNNLRHKLRSAVDEHLSTDRDLQTERDSHLGLQSKHASLEVIRGELEKEVNQQRSHIQSVLQQNALLINKVAELELKLELAVNHITELETVNKEVRDSFEVETNVLRDELRSAVDEHLRSKCDLQAEKDSHLGLQARHASLQVFRGDLERKIEELESHTRSVLEQNEFFNHKVVELEAKLELAGKHSADFHLLNKELQESVASLQVETNFLRDDLRVAADKHLITDRDLQAEKDSRLDLQARHASLEVVKDDLKREIDELLSHRNEISAQNSSLCSKLADFEARSEEARKRTDDLQAENKGLHKSVTSLEVRINLLQDDLRSAVDKNLSIDTKFRAERDNHLRLQASHASLQKKQDELEEELHELQSQRSSMLEQNVSLASTVADLETRLEFVTNRSTDLEMANKELKATTTSMELVVHTLRQELQMAVDKHLRTDEDLQSERDYHQKLQAKHASLNVRRDELEDELDKVRSEREQLLKQNSCLGNSVSELEARLVTEVKHTVDLESLTCQLQKTITTCQEEADGLRNELQTAVENRLSTDRDLQFERDHHLQLQAMHSSLKLSRDVLEKDLDDMQSHKSSLLEQNTTLMARVTELEAELEEVVRQTLHFQSVNNERQKTITGLEVDIRSLREELQITMDRSLNVIRDLQSEKTVNLSLQARQASMEVRIDELERELEDIHSQKATALQQHAYLTDKVADLEAHLHTTVDRTADLEAVNKHLQDKVTRVETEAQNLRNELQSAVDKHLSTDRDLISEKDQHLVLQHKHASLEVQRDELEKELEEIKSQKVLVLDENASLTGIVTHLEAKLETSICYTAELQTVQKELQSRATSFEAEVQTLRRKLQSSVDKLLGMDCDLQSERENHLGLQARHEALRVNKEVLEQKLDELKGERTLSLGQNAAMSHHNAELEVRLISAMQQNIDIDLVNKELKENLTRFEVEAQSLREDLQSAVDKHISIDLDLQSQRDCHLELQARHQDLMERIEKLEEEVNTLTDEKASMLEQTAALNTHNAELQAILDTAMHQTADLRTEIKGLHENLAKVEVEVHTLRDELQSAVDMHLRTDRDLHLERNNHLDLQAKHETLRMKSDELEKELNNLKDCISSMQEKIATLSDQNSELEVRLDTTVRQTAELDSVKEDLEDIITRLELDLRTAVNSNLAIHRDLQSEKDDHLSLQAKHASLQDRRDEQEKSLEDLQLEKASLLEKTTSLTDTLALLEEKLEAATTQVMEQQTVNKELRVTLTSFEVEAQSLRDQLQSAIDKNSSTDLDLQSERDNHLDLQARHEALKVRRELLNQALDALKSENTVLLGQNAFIGDRNEELQASLQTAVNQTSDLETIINGLQEKLGNVENEAHSLQEELQSAIDMNFNTNRDLHLERNNHAHLQAKHDFLQGRSDEMGKELKNLKDDKSSMQKEIATLSGKNDGLEARLDSGLEETAELETVLRSLQVTVTKLELEAQSLRDDLQSAINKHLATDRDLQSEKVEHLSLQGMYASLELRKDELEEKLEKLQSEKASFLEQNVSLADALAQLETKLVALTSQAAEQQTVNKELRGTVTSFEAEAQRLQDQLQSTVDKHLGTNRDLQFEREKHLGLQANHEALQITRQWLEQELEALKGEKTVLLGRNAFMGEQNAELQNNLQTAVNQTGDLETKIEGLQEKLTNAEVAAHTLEEELQSAVNKNLITDRDLQFERNNYLHLQAKHETLQVRSVELELELKILRDDKSSLREEIATLSEKNEEMAAKLDNVKKDLMGTEFEAQSLHDDLEETHRDLQSEKDHHLSLQAKHASLEVRRDELEKELQKIQLAEVSVLNQNAVLADTVAQLEAKLEAASTQVAELGTVNRKLQMTVTSSMIETQSLRDQLQAVVVTRDELQEEFEKLQSQKASVLDLNATLADRVVHLEAKLAVSVREAADVDTDNTALRETVEQFKTESHDLRQELLSAVDKHICTDRNFQLERQDHKALQAKHLDVQARICELEQEREKLLQQNTSLSDRIAKLDAHLETTAKASSDIKTVNRELYEMIAGLELRADILREELNSTVDKHLSTDRELQTEKESHLGLQAKHASLDVRRDELEKELDELQVQKALSEERNLFLDDTVAALEAKLEVAAKQIVDLECGHRELHALTGRSDKESQRLREELRLALDRHVQTDLDLQSERRYHQDLQASLELTKGELEKEVAGLQAHLDAAVKSTAEMQLANNELQEFNKEYEMKEQSLREELQMAINKRLSTDRDLKSERDQHLSLQARHAFLEVTTDELKTKLDDLHSHKASALEQIAILDGKLAELLAKLDAAVDQTSQKDLENKHLQKTVWNFESEVQNLREELRVTVDSYQTTSLDLQTERGNHLELQLKHVSLQKKRDEMERDIQHLQKRLKELQSHDAALLKQNASLSDEKSALEVRLDTASEHISELQNVIATSEQGAQNTREELRLVIDKHQRTDREFQCERECHLSLQSSHESLQLKLEEMEGELVQLQKTLGEVQAHKAYTLEQNSNLSDEVAKLETELQVAVSGAAELEAMNKRLEETATRFELENQALREDLHLAVVKHQTVDRDLQSEKDNHHYLQARHTLLQEAKDAEAKELQDLHKRYKELQTYSVAEQEEKENLIAELGKQLGTTTEHASNSEKTVTRLEMETQRLIEELQSAAVKQQATERDLQSGKEIRLSLQISHASLQQRRDQIEEELHLLQKRYDELHSQHTSVLEQKASLTEKLADLEASLETAMKQTVGLGMVNEELLQTVTRFETEAESLREELQVAADHHHSTTRDLQCEKTSHLDLQSRHADSQQKREEAEKELLRTQNLLDELRNQKVSALEQNAILGSRVAELKARVQADADRTAELETENRDLQGTIKRLQTEATSLRDDLLEAVDKHQNADRELQTERERYRALQRRTDEVEEESQHLQRRYEELQALQSSIMIEKTSFRNEVVKLEGKLQSAIDRNKVLQAAFEGLEFGSENLRGDLQAAVNKQKTMDRDLQLERENYSSLQANHATLQQEKFRAHAELLQSKKLLEELQILKNTIAKENEALGVETAELKAKLQKAVDQTIDLKTQNRELQTLITISKAECTDLKENLQAEENKRETADRNLRLQVENNSGLQSNHAALKEEKGHIEAELLKSQELLEELRFQRASVQEENTLLRASLGEVRANLRTAVDQKADMNVQIRELQATITRLELEGTSLNEELKVERNQSTNRYVMLERQLRTLQTERGRGLCGCL